MVAIYEYHTFFIQGFPHIFIYVFPHVTHMNHLGIYTGILYISHMNHIGILDRNHMFQDTHMWKLLTCEGDINLATIQLLCGYHTTPMRLPYRGIAVLLPYNLYGYHATTMWLHATPGSLPDSVWLPYNSHVTTIQLPCGAP